MSNCTDKQLTSLSLDIITRLVRPEVCLCSCVGHSSPRLRIPWRSWLVPESLQGSEDDDLQPQTLYNTLKCTRMYWVRGPMCWAWWECRNGENSRRKFCWRSFYFTRICSEFSYKYTRVQTCQLHVEWPPGRWRTDLCIWNYMKNMRQGKANLVITLTR